MPSSFHEGRIDVGGKNQTTWRAKTVITPKGPMTRRQIAEAFSIPFGTVCRRLWQKYPPDRLFMPPMKAQYRSACRNTRKVRTWKTAWGTETSKEVARRLHIKTQNFVDRVRIFNWTLEDAVNTPGYGIRGRHFIIPPDEYRRRYQELHAND